MKRENKIESTVNDLDTTIQIDYNKENIMTLSLAQITTKIRDDQLVKLKDTKVYLQLYIPKDQKFII